MLKYQNPYVYLLYIEPKVYQNTAILHHIRQV
ncbi:hypothetical protein FHW89_003857 [Mucilaginibacter sp. SG564]|nr:hypothetical protein [Mucilaginibacter sp. SG564]